MLSMGWCCSDDHDNSVYIDVIYHMPCKIERERERASVNLEDKAVGGNILSLYIVRRRAVVGKKIHRSSQYASAVFDTFRITEYITYYTYDNTCLQFSLIFQPLPPPSLYSPQRTSYF
jgi:hypothetical protein